MIEEMEYQLKNLLKNNQPQDYIEIIEKENEEYIEIINKLQSKIDKANKILDKYAKTEVEDYKKIMKFYKELRNVLKEDK